jgi:hypothetical protein
VDWKDITEWIDGADKWENELDKKLERLAEQKHDQVIHIPSNINILESSKTAAIASQLHQTLIDTGVWENTPIATQKRKRKCEEVLYKESTIEACSKSKRGRRSFKRIWWKNRNGGTRRFGVRKQKRSVKERDFRVEGLEDKVKELNAYPHQWYWIWGEFWDHPKWGIEVSFLKKDWSS